jgi:ATP-dependent RNA helicase SUPV3L1/SUV3
MSISFSPIADRELSARGSGVTAVLGPTNTGKTHLAIERMLAHSSGMIGLPLRLLAREVYNRAVERVGAEAVALVTGEEKIKPPNPRFWVATVEAMPRELDVAFLAVDEIQLAADFERGHVFTDRMLHRRGREETLVLGAATMRPIVERLLPGASIVSRPRLSRLTFSGEKKLTRLPRRSAIVAFSAEEVYAIAELIRRQRGGAAVVLGALSPRTRNAQVELYQSGEVDYLVATDAIGMGLNLDVDHVAFASDRKFDGYQFRKLNPSELAQIAGRAGRATRDGTFGTSGRCPPFETELVQALESHTFEPVRLVQWRNSDLDFSSVGALQAALAMAPNESPLARAPVAEDILVLDHAARDDDVRAWTRTKADVERLWDVCQLPDYRKIAPANHAELVVTLYGFLQRDGAIKTDWFAHQVALADRTDGDIDTLSTRIAHIRTWTFAANRPDWLADPEYWQGVTRAVEDRLSDALHERLTERFVDRRTSVLMRRLRENAALEPDFNKTGDVVVEGHLIGRLDGFVFVADASSGGSEAKALQNAAQKALAGEIAARAVRLAEAPDDQFVLAADGTLRWIGAAVGKLQASEELLRPRIRIIADEHLTGAPRESVEARLSAWLKAHIERLLGPLAELASASDVTGIARGVAFQLVEALGVLDRSQVADQVKALDQPARATLRKYGVRFGAYHIYLPALVKPAPRKLATQLWALRHEETDNKVLDDLRHLAGSGRTSIAADPAIDPALYSTTGYRVCGARAVRVDILERLADLIRPALAWREGAPGARPPGAVGTGVFTVANTMTSLIGASGEEFASILRALGYRMERRPKPPEPAEPLAKTGPASTDAPAAAEPAQAAPEGELPQDAQAVTQVVAVEAGATDSGVAAMSEPASAQPEALVVEDAPSGDSGLVSPPPEPATIEVWRAGRMGDRRRVHARQRGRAKQVRSEASGPSRRPLPEPPAAEAGAAVLATEAAGAATSAPTIEAEAHAKPRDRARQRRPEHRMERQEDRQYRQKRARPPGKRFEPRVKRPDPNSPFAKLAALKAQLEADAKERR